MLRETTEHQLHKFREALALHEADPSKLKAANPILWQAIYDGIKAMIDDLDEQLFDMDNEEHDKVLAEYNGAD